MRGGLEDFSARGARSYLVDGDSMRVCEQIFVPGRRSERWFPLLLMKQPDLEVSLKLSGFTFAEPTVREVSIDDEAFAVEMGP